ncbi:Nuclear pore complex protein [Hordeum vulgare]|nr:Nuclear pore complex protein [Hordeum vulgare]
MLGTSVSRFSEARALHDGSSIPRRPNAGLLLEDVKQEAADYSDIDGLNGPKLFGSAKRTSLDGGSGRRAARSALNLVKLEDDMPREGETTSTTFASLLDSAIQVTNYIPSGGLLLCCNRSYSTIVSAIVLWLERLASQILDLDKKVAMRMLFGL